MEFLGEELKISIKESSRYTCRRYPSAIATVINTKLKKSPPLDRKRTAHKCS